MKSLKKSMIRNAVYARLRWLPVSELQAARWAERMKRWPAIFAQHPYIVERQVAHGARMKLGLIDVIERALLVRGSWDEHVAAVMRAVIRPNFTVVDVGANIGYFSLLAASLVGDEGRVVCIEPSQRNLFRLCEHLWMNRCSNALVLSIAAGNSNDCVAIAFPTYNNAGAASLRHVESVQLQRTYMVSLDDVFEAQGIAPDFIKLDIEGFELNALKGMERTLRRCSPVIVCELTDKFLRELGQSACELVAYMESLGYACARAVQPPGPAISSNDQHLLGQQIDVVFRRVG